MAPSSTPSSASSAEAFAPVSRLLSASFLIRDRGMWELRTDLDGSKGDHGTVDFVDGSIDFLKVVRVGDDLVTSDNVLR